jgi:hypothetical protein
VVRLTTCSETSDDITNIHPDRGLITATAHEVERNPKIES